MNRTSKPGLQPQSTDSTVRAVDSTAAAQGFRRGQPESVHLVQERVQRIVAYRGYSIPHDQRVDLHQEILAQLWSATRKPQFNEGGGFWGLVELVATRRCIDWIRSQRTFVSLDESAVDPGKNPLDSTLDLERRQLLDGALDSLGDPCRQLILLRFKEKVGYREIGRRLGKKAGALRMQMVRCISRLRDLITSSGRSPLTADGRSQP